MALYRRGSVWWYCFEFRGDEYRGSTFQSNKNKAKLVESKVRSDVALEQFGIGPQKITPYFQAYMDDTFLPYVRNRNKAKPRTVKFYEEKTRRLLDFEPFQEARLSAVLGLVEKYITYRLASDRKSRGKGKISIASVNRELTTLRKALRYAWKTLKLLPDEPEVKLLAGEKGRDFIVSGELENAFFAVAPYPLNHACVLIADLGLRPDECVSLRKTDIFAEHLQVRDGKTGKRTLILTGRAKTTLKELFALWPKSPWVFPGQRRGKHLTVWALDNLHAALRTEKKWPPEFIVYSFRHTFGTRLAESGASPFVIQEAMGHADIRTSRKYVHSTPEHMVLAMKRKEALDKALRGEKVLTESQEGVKADP